MIKYIFSLILIFLCCIAKGQVQFPELDVQHYTFNLRLNDQNDTIYGKALITVKFLKDVNAFGLNLVKPGVNGKGMLITSAGENGKNLSFLQDSDVFKVQTSAKSQSLHTYVLSYKGIPADGLIISKNEFGHRTFFGDNWPDRARNWLPSADYPADKATVDFIVTAPDRYQVVANGTKNSEEALPGHLKRTHWHEDAPLATKVMVIGVADFAVDHTGDVGKVPVYTYVFPESKAAGFKSYAVAAEILPFYIKMFGPFAYEKLANVQSKTIFGGMENASAIFYFENSVTSKGIEELMAHEIAHQWFGDAASETNFAHLWLSEGFATYMTNVYLEHKYGIDTLQKRLTADRKTVLDFELKRLTPVVDTAVKGNFMQMLNANSYQKGGWALHMLRRKLGDSLFWKGIRAYYAKYDGGNANTEDFKNVMEEAAGQNLDQFFNQWLYTAGHPQLAVTWKYNAEKKEVLFTIIQKQDYLFEFLLEISVDGLLQTVEVKDKTTEIGLPASGEHAAVSIDPNVNLLAGFDLQGG
jgi:aminopeptidase N